MFHLVEDFNSVGFNNVYYNYKEPEIIKDWESRKAYAPFGYAYIANTINIIQHVSRILNKQPLVSQDK